MMKKLSVLLIVVSMCSNISVGQIHPVFDQLVESYDSNGFYYLFPEVLEPGQLDSLFAENFPEYADYTLGLKKTRSTVILP